MKKASFLFLLLCVFSIVYPQTYNIKWGNEIRIKRGSIDLDIISADNTALFFAESRFGSKGFFSFNYSSDPKLFKFDKNYTEVFEKNYKKELKGLDFHSFQPLENDIYLFATAYEKKEKLFKIFGARIDKNSGELQGEFRELGSYLLETKRDGYELKLKSIQQGKSFVMVTNVSGKDRISLGISLLDQSLKTKQNTLVDLSFNQNEFSLQDVQYTTGNKIVLLGKQFEETQVGKKKRKRFVFKQYVMMIYDNKGKKEKDIPMHSGDKFVIGGQLVEQADGGLLLAGFYSNTAKKEDLNGFFINTVNPVNATLSLSSYKEINAAMLGNSIEEEGDADDETKADRKRASKAKEDGDEDEFPNSFIIRSVDINPADQSIIISSEVSKYRYSFLNEGTYDNTTKKWTNVNYDIHTFTNQDILIINADRNGDIKWLNAIPKSQEEQIKVRSVYGYNLSFFTEYNSFFATGGSMPFYSSYISLVSKNNLCVIFNDHSSNNVNAQYGDKVKKVYNFRKRSNVYGISVDLATGKMTRKMIASNDGESILMPRHGFATKNEVVIPSWKMRVLAKTELKFARISVN